MRTHRLVSICCLSITAAQGASIPAKDRIVAPTAVARISGGDYCFEHDRRIDYEHQPPSWLAMKVRIQVAYHNPGARPLIIPLEHERIIYTATREGVMNIFKDIPNLETLNPSVKPMIHLPPKVSPDNPLEPKNDYFAVIPPQGDLVSPLAETLLFPVNHKLLFRHDPDLRGRKLYIRL